MAGKFNRITGMYPKNKDGKKYMSGKVRDGVSIPPGATVFLFPNSYKQKENDPDFVLSWTAEDGSQGSAPAYQGRSNSQPTYNGRNTTPAASSSEIPW